MVEQRSPKPTVEGSSPSAPANEKQRPLLGVFCFWALCGSPFFIFSLLSSPSPFLSLFSSFPCCYCLTAYVWPLRGFVASICAFAATRCTCMLSVRHALTVEIAPKQL